MFVGQTSRRPARDPEGRMPLMDHLRELRTRMVKALIGLALGIGAGFVVFEPVWAFLQTPYCALPQSAQLDSDECRLIFTGVFDAFFLQFKVAVIVGILVSCPVWLWQIWQFVTPALQGRERWYSVAFMGAAIPLFTAGAALAYLISELALRVMFSFAPEGADALITITNYLSYMLTIMLVFGAAFVLPLFVVLLNLMGVLPHDLIAKWRRVVFFVAFAFSAIVTPADPLTMVVLGSSIIVLFEAAELVAYINDRRRAATTFDDVGDDEISPLPDDASAGELSGDDAAPPRNR
ncbi:twin-arginine translocase subunit TatC [Lipingzhangella sp. LS1_29]|uniref:Sec-independent protein translocase protein TatC n=1 Tax=Lipingzhangella rawalii TaxID=2055835 RepID=A0ABU2H0X1_9ACTN|nr:twin-arginine translocase subunit TatC [Lipingzhangella rawalii]MDS1268949.1 twin-arginine translocase subunit TatC [Lipingzhangella rawalii]